MTVRDACSTRIYNFLDNKKRGWRPVSVVAYWGKGYDTSMRINLRDPNPARGEMLIETTTTKHIPSSVGAACEIAVRNTYRIKL